MSCLDFNCNINIEKNPLNLNIDDFLDIAIRNNSKRRFLFVSKCLGKHIACDANDMDKLGRYLVDIYNKTKVNSLSGTVISFAETGTALGHSVFNYLDGDYEFIHTTRENIEGYKSLEFLEEHSHATEHNLYFENLKYLIDGDEVLLVDDEITTANTCINIIKKIQSLYPKKRYTICSILNWVEGENLDRINKIQKELNCEINFVYLFRGNFEFSINNLYSEDKQTYNSSNNELEVKYLDLDLDHYIGDKQYLRYSGRLGINKKEQENLIKLVNRESKKINLIDKNKDVLFLGTEEFMYIPMLFAKVIDGKIHYHSTTRSPIISNDKSDYCINTKFILESFYNKGVENFIYNIDKKNYEECFIFVEIKKDKDDFKNLIDIIKKTSIKRLNIVNFKENLKDGEI